MPKFWLHHVLRYQIAKKFHHFQETYAHQEPHNHLFLWGIGGPRFFFSLRLLILHKFGKESVREQAAISKLAKELIINALKDCCELVTLSFMAELPYSQLVA